MAIGLLVLALVAAVPICSAAVGPVTGITADNPSGSPPYNILSITVGSYTVAADRLATGTTAHGGLGQTVTIPDQWANLGYSRVAAASGDPVSGSGNGQSLEGMSWAITDLLDATGNPFTNNSVIEGIAIVNRNGVYPIGFFALVGDTPEPEPVRQLDVDGLVVIEAELYDDTVPSAEFEFVFNTDFDGHSRAGCMRSLPSGTDVSGDVSSRARLDYQVEFKQAGMVYVWGRAYAPTSAENSFHLGLNGQLLVDRIDVDHATTWVWVNDGGASIEILYPQLLDAGVGVLHRQAPADHRSQLHHSRMRTT